MTVISACLAGNWVSSIVVVVSWVTCRSIILLVASMICWLRKEWGIAKVVSAAELWSWWAPTRGAACGLFVSRKGIWIVLRHEIIVVVILVRVFTASTTFLLLLFRLNNNQILMSSVVINLISGVSISKIKIVITHIAAAVVLTAVMVGMIWRVVVAVTSTTTITGLWVVFVLAHCFFLSCCLLAFATVTGGQLIIIKLTKVRIKRMLKLYSIYFIWAAHGYCCWCKNSYLSKFTHLFDFY